jgi:hypothetical protein
MHSMLRTVFDNRLIFPPVSRLKMILECGFGAGDWSVDVAEQYPDAEVRIQAFLFQTLSATQWRVELALQYPLHNKS